MKQVLRGGLRLLALMANLKRAAAVLLTVLAACAPGAPCAFWAHPMEPCALHHSSCTGQGVFSQQRTTSAPISLLLYLSLAKHSKPRIASLALMQTTSQAMRCGAPGGSLLWTQPLCLWTWTLLTLYQPPPLSFLYKSALGRCFPFLASLLALHLLLRFIKCSPRETNF